MIYLFILYMFLLLVDSRELINDPCKCLNGGTCAQGTCICPNGYSGEQCQIEGKSTDYSRFLFLSVLGSGMAMLHQQTFLFQHYSQVFAKGAWKAMESHQCKAKTNTAIV